MAALVGAIGTVVNMNQAVFGNALGNPAYQSQLAVATATGGQAAIIAGYNSSLASSAAATLATTVLNNMFVTTAAGVTAANVATLTTALTQAFAAYPTAKGQVISNLANILGGFEGEASWGPAATAFNNQAAADFQYSTNTANANAGVPSAVSTYTLTTGIDTTSQTANGVVFQGSVSATAAADTFQAFDSITSTGLNDILNITAFDYADNAALAAASVNGVSTINVRALDPTAGDNLAVNADNFIGATAINSDRSSSEITLTNLATGASAGMNGNGTTSTGQFTFGYKTASAAATLNINGGTTGGAVAISTTPAALVINSTGAANIIGTLNIGAAATSVTINAATGLTTGAITGGALTTITVTGAAATAATPVTPAANDITSAVQIGAALPAAVTTINASGMTAGGVSATLIGTVSSFIGGAGTDTVTTAALTTTVASAINAGAGTDVLRIAATTDVDTTAEGALYAGFETLDNNGTTVNFSNFANSTFTAVRVGGTVTFSNMSATQAANVTVYANSTGTYGLSGAGNVGSINTINLTVNDGVAATNTITLADITAASVEIINIKAVENVTISALAATSSLTNMAITGAGNVSLTTGAAAAVLNSAIDASALTGTFTYVGSGLSANGQLVTGSSTKVNTITGSNQADRLVGGGVNDTLTGLTGGDQILGGAGNDTIRGNRGTDTITTGDGNDIVTIRTGDSYTFATQGTLGAETITTVAGTVGAGVYTIAVNINGMSVTTADIAHNAADAAISNAIRVAIGTSAEMSSYVTLNAADAATVIVTSAQGPLSVLTTVSNAGTAGAATAAVTFTTNSSASSGVLTTDSITDFNFGGSTLATAVDTINLTGLTTNALTVQATSAITGATLGEAVNALFNAGGALNGTTNTVGIYTFGADSYLIGNIGAVSAGGNFGSAGTAISTSATLLNASDFIVKITGFVGTLDASDFTFVA